MSIKYFLIFLSQRVLAVAMKNNCNHSNVLSSIMITNPINYSYFADSKTRYLRIIGITRVGLKSAIDSVNSEYSACLHTFSCGLNNSLLEYVKGTDFVDLSDELWASFCGKLSTYATSVFRDNMHISHTFKHSSALSNVALTLLIEYSSSYRDYDRNRVAVRNEFTE